MGKIKGFIYDKISTENREQSIILFAVVSLFLPYVISAAVLIAVSLRALIKKDIRSTALGGIDGKLLLAFFVINFLSPLLHINYLGFAAFLGFNTALIFALYCRRFMTAAFFEKLADTVAFMSMSSAAVAWIQKCTQWADTEFRAPSVFFNPNYYGAVITIVVLLCFYRFIEKRSNRGFLLAAMLVNVVGLLAADCQSAFFCILFGIWIMLLLTKRYKTFAFVSVLAVLTVVFLTKLTFIMPRISKFFDNISVRSRIWQAGARAFLEVPFFGRGMLGYFQIFEKFNGPLNYHCHNTLIDLLLSFGVVGSVPILWILIRNIIHAGGKRNAPLFFALLAAALLHGVVDVTLVWIQSGALIVLMLSSVYTEKQS